MSSRLPLLFILLNTTPVYSSDRLSEVKKALEYVNRVENSQCSGGTEEEYTDPAIRSANILSSLIQIHGDLNSVEENFFYTLARNNVHGDSLIFGSGIAVIPDYYRDYHQFCPYAFKKNGIVSAFDIAVNYDYMTNDTIWFYTIRNTNFENATIETDLITFNESVSHLSRVPFLQPTAKYEDGYWTNPYYDCGGGDIWMITYTAPLLFINDNNRTQFAGVAGIDIELTNVDINQCDLAPSDAGKEALDIFRGTHYCQNTTKCVPLVGQGFRRGAYQCQCETGYYYPIDSPVKAYSGYEIEAYVDLNNQNVELPFRCLQCSRGCDTCVDSTPCLFNRELGIRLLVVLLTVIMIIGCGVVSLSVYKFQHEMVIKTASPIFLQIMCLGAIIMCCQIFIVFTEPTNLLCALEIWPHHLGFSIMYGALLIKTWRISIIFSVGSIKRVSLPDIALLKRLLLLIGGFVLLLTVWTAVNPPRVEILTLTNSLKFYNCTRTWWNYTMYGVEAVLLLYGVYLCFTVRKAPAHFNESKHITWAVYNAVILGSFIIILTQFMLESGGPDVLYLLLLAQLQVFITITMALIFIPKFWAIHKRTTLQENRHGSQVTTITGRVKQRIPTTGSTMKADVRSVAVQTDAITFDLSSSQQIISLKTSKLSSKVSPLLEAPTNGF